MKNSKPLSFHRKRIATEVNQRYVRSANESVVACTENAKKKALKYI